MRKTLVTIALIFLIAVPAQSWKNGGDSKDANHPVFGTHDYVAFQGYKLAGPSKLPWLRKNLNAYFLGTEAPDVGAKLAGAEGGYKDTGACHCILFDLHGGVTRDRAELRVKQEFEKAQRALAAGNKKLAAFYAGAMAHYLGDLSQFCHIMGPQSHWGSEEKKVHSNYEAAVEKTMDAQTRKSSLLETFFHKVDVPGDTPEEIARAAAMFTEKGNGSHTPGAMHAQYKQLTQAKKHMKPEEWDQDFREQTGANVNFSANAIAKLLAMI